MNDPFMLCIEKLGGGGISECYTGLDKGNSRVCPRSYVPHLLKMQRPILKITDSIYNFLPGGSHYKEMMWKPRSKMTKHNLIYSRLNWLKVSQFDENLSVIDEANGALK